MIMNLSRQALQWRIIKAVLQSGLMIIVISEYACEIPSKVKGLEKGGNLWNMSKIREGLAWSTVPRLAFAQPEWAVTPKQGSLLFEAVPKHEEKTCQFLA